jgi:hypothetical protein
MGMNLPKDVEARCLELAGVNPVAGLSEAQFQARVVALARANSWAVYHTHDSRRSEAGFPDLVMLRHGALLVAELKVGTNRPTPEQCSWIAEFALVPQAQVYVWKPEDWPQITEALK